MQKLRSRDELKLERIDERKKADYALVVSLMQNHFLPTFKAVKRGRRARGVAYEADLGDNRRIEVRMWEQLDAADQDLFLGIVAHAGANGQVCSLGHMVDAEGTIANFDIIAIQVSAHELLKTIGRRTGGKDHQWLMKSLDRLSDCSIKYRSSKSRWSLRVLDYAIVIDDEESKVRDLVVFLNPVSALLFTGEKAGDLGYVRHGLESRLSLKSDAAKVLHGYLVGLIRAGGSRKLHVDTLIKHVYAGDVDPSTSTHKMRRKAVKDALREIGRLKGWSIKVGRSHKVEIGRKSGTG